MTKPAAKMIKTSLRSPSKKTVYKKKIGGKIEAVNNSGNIIVVAATKSQLKRAGLPQRVQSKSMMKEKFNSRANESLGMKNKGPKTQSYKARRNERKGEQNAFGNLFKLIK